MNKEAPLLPCDSLPAIPCVVTVGFVGHRDVDRSSLRPALQKAFELLAAVRAGLSGLPTGGPDGATLAQAYAKLGQGDEGPWLRLLTGYAPGADRLAVAVWRELSMGRVHGLFPFIDPSQPEKQAWTDRPVASPNETCVQLNSDEMPIFDAWTGLDGIMVESERPPRDAHLEQSRWLVRWSDVLVAAWNGMPAAGTGGTADTVSLALARGTPVLWIDTTVPGMPVRLLIRDQLWADSGFAELLDVVSEPCRREEVAPNATPSQLLATLSGAMLPPGGPLNPLVANGAAASLPQHGLDDDQTERRLDYASTDCHGLPPAGGRLTLAQRLSRKASRGIAGSWSRFMRSLGSSPGDPSPARSSDSSPCIVAHLERADASSSFLGNLHRGTQVGLLIAAVLAVFLGTVPALEHQGGWPGKNQLKRWVVPAEAIVLLLAYGVWKLGYIAENHQRWSDTRRLAERLRLLAATWPLGFDINDDQLEAPLNWTEWYARSVCRAVGPPTGPLLAARVAEIAARVRLDPQGIVVGQEAYHQLAAARLHRLAHKIHAVETRGFVLLLGSLVAFTIWYWTALQTGLITKPPSWVGGLLLIMSATVPAIGAACLALEAKLGVTENERRSLRLAAAFSHISSQLADAKTTAEQTELIRRAATMHLADIDTWHEDYLRRKMVVL